MGTEVMQPRDLLTVTRVPPVPFHRRRNLFGDWNLTNLTVNRKGNSAVNRKASPKWDQKKSHKGTKAKRKHGFSDSGLVMGQVTILKRGESLNSLTFKTRGESVSPLMLPKQINVQALADEYSVSTLYSSPSPRSVPLPSFFMKQLVRGEMKSFDDSATRDLRRLLRLD